MLRTIVRKELLANLLSLRITVCYAVIGLLVIFAITIRGMHYKAVEKTYRTNIERFEEKLTPPEQEQDGNDIPRSPFQYDVQIPPSRLGIFFQGYSAAISRPFTVDILWSDNRPLGRYALDSPVLAVYRAYDLLFITAFIVSLLVIFISYDALAGERESGTFRLVLANRISRSTLILGKLIGGALTVTVPYLIAVVVGLFILTAGLGIGFTGQEYLLLACFLGTTVLFILLVYLFSMVFSALYRSPATALFTSLALWLVAAFGVPYLSVQAARSLVPVPTFGEYTARRAEIKREDNAVAVKENKRINKTYTGKEHSWKMRMAWRKAHLSTAERWSALRRERLDALRRQAGLGIALARLSPVGTLIIASSRFTRTGIDDFDHAQDWKKDLEVANKAVHDQRSFAQEKVRMDLELAGREVPDDLGFEPFDESTLPDRTYRRIPPVDVLRNSVFDLVTLFLEAAALFLACFFLFIRRHEA